MEESAALEVILAMGRYVGRLEARVAELEEPVKAVERLRGLGHIVPIPTLKDPLAQETFRWANPGEAAEYNEAFDEATG